MVDGPVDICFGSDIHTMAISWMDMKAGMLNIENRKSYRQRMSMR